MDLHGISAHLEIQQVLARHILGHDVERIDGKSTFTPAREDLDLKASGVTIKKGEVACWEHTWTGYVDGKPKI